MTGSQRTSNARQHEDGSPNMVSAVGDVRAETLHFCPRQERTAQ